METKITQKHICSIFLRCTLNNIKANDLFFLPVLLLSYPLKFASHVTNNKPLRGMLQNHCRHLLAKKLPKRLLCSLKVNQSSCNLKNGLTGFVFFK